MDLALAIFRLLCAGATFVLVPIVLGACWVRWRELHEEPDDRSIARFQGARQKLHP